LFAISKKGCSVKKGSLHCPAYLFGTAGKLHPQLNLPARGKTLANIHAGMADTKEKIG
jgi:hypothetical protein